MKNGEVLKLFNALENISSNPNLKFNFTVGYALAKNRELLRTEAEIIYSLRKKIFNEFGKVGENGDLVIPKENIDQVNSKINELMEVENSVQILSIPITAFEESEEKINLEDMTGLSYMIYIPEYTSESIGKNQE